MGIYAIPLSAKSNEYVTLTVGLTEERHISNMPEQIGDDMNYNRNFVHIAVAPRLKTIRFEPVAPGTTNFTLRDNDGKKIVEYVITVRKSNLNKVAQEIKSLLG